MWAEESASDVGVGGMGHSGATMALGPVRDGRWHLALGCDRLLMSGGPSDRNIQAMIDRNACNLLRLQVDLFEHVFDIMGPPQRVEGYPWGLVWLYRTAARQGADHTGDRLYPACLRPSEDPLGMGERLLGDAPQ